MPTDELSRTFAALAHPTRRAILDRLAEGEATVSELAKPFSVSPPAISRHLRVLEEAGLISRSRVAQTRPTALRPAALDDADAWVTACVATWEGRLDRLGRHLDETQGKRGR
jgi:DNA-binding transcriptional ArsR family regulator